MKSLISLLFLINCLAFFIFNHLQKHPVISVDQVDSRQELYLTSPLPIVLLSEVSKGQLAVMNRSNLPTAVTTVKTDSDAEHCELIGPFESKALADGALHDLVANKGLPKMIVSEQKGAEYWLIIPMILSEKIVDERWMLYKSKKRYKEVCMKVAYMNKFQ